MKFITFSVETPVGPVARVGILDGTRRVIDLTSAMEYALDSDANSNAHAEAHVRVPPDMRLLLQRGVAGIDDVHHALAAVQGRTGVSTRSEAMIDFVLDDVTILAPLRVPGTIRVMSTNAAEGSRRRNYSPPPENWQHFPGAYKRCGLTVGSAYDKVRWPHFCQALDIEVGLALVVGRQGRDLSIEGARSLIAGFTLYAEPVARMIDWNEERPGPFKSRNFQFLLGPAIVTPEEFDERVGVAEIRVNGDCWYSGNIAANRTHWSPELLAYISDNEFLDAGDVIALGPIGASSSLDTGRWLKPGDVFEFEVGGIGAIRTEIAPKSPQVVTWGSEGMPSQLLPEVGAPEGYWSAYGWADELAWMQRLRAEGAGRLDP